MRMAKGIDAWHCLWCYKHACHTMSSMRKQRGRGGTTVLNLWMLGFCVFVGTALEISDSDADAVIMQDRLMSNTRLADDVSPSEAREMEHDIDDGISSTVNTAQNAAVTVYQDPQLSGFEDEQFNVIISNETFYACIDDIIIGEIDGNLNSSVIRFVDHTTAQEELKLFYRVNPDRKRKRKSVIGFAGVSDHWISTDYWKWPAGNIPVKRNFARYTNAMKTNWEIAVRSLHIATSIRVFDVTNEGNFVRVQRSQTSCSANIGRRHDTTIRRVLLDDWCTHGNMVHELLHSFGFHHEHVRFDRDQYLTISSVDESNYGKVLRDGQDQGQYDFHSMYV